MNFAKFSVRNSVLVNLLMIGVIFLGWNALNRLPTELNSPVSFNWVFITVLYPGASPEESESLIVDPIEAEIQDVNNIEGMNSQAGEGFGFVLVKFEDMSDIDFMQRYNELKAELDKVNFPDEAENPQVDDFSSSDFLPLINVNMSFQIPESNVQKIADEIEEDIKNINGVSKVQVSGFGERQIWIEVDPARLQTNHVSIEQIVFALKARNLNVPGGNISFGKTEYLIRSLGEYQSVNEIRNTIIRTNSSGDFLRIGDVADVRDTRSELNILSRANGEPSISFSVSKKPDANSIDVINDIKSLVNEYKAEVPDGVSFSYLNDSSVLINRIINVLRNNALTGAILIFVILYLFLGKSNAFLAFIGIPITFLITFIFMDITGYSLNGNTLFALVMVLGIIVDDAIIVLENSHRYRLLGYSSEESTVKGTREVMAPILSSVGTNIAAFLPLILLPGIMGKFMRIIPIIFSLALLASLFEAFVLLPAHYADWTKKSKVYKRGEKKFFTKLRAFYERLLVKTLRRRYLTTVVLLMILILSFGLIPLVGVEMFSTDDMDQVKIFVKMEEGTSLQETDRIMKKYEEKAFELPPSLVKTIITNVGLLQGDEEWLVKKNVAQILIQLTPREEREVSSDEIIERLRKSCAGISGPTSVVFTQIPGGPPVGKPISIKVQGKYLDQIKAAALELQDSIKTIPGAYDIADDFPPGKKEVRVKIDEDKAARLGFSVQFIAMNIRYAFDGVTATEYRDGDDEIDVVVKYRSEKRSSLDDILNLTLTNVAGNTVALRDMVKFEIEPGPTTIRRMDQKRTILVSGEINKDITSIDKISRKISKIFPKLENKYAGVSFEFGGQFDEFTKTFENISYLFLLGLIIIFLILGAQFRSYSQPLVILTAVPFAFIGAMFGLLLSGKPFSIVSMFGFVALAGIVVNDAIVLISFMNDRRMNQRLGNFRIWRSIIDAGRLRLRPIILTSFTTISGLIPMGLGLGGVSEMWAPLADVIIFGLLVSTLLTLFIIPCFLAILDDMKRLRKKASNLLAK